MFCPRYRLLTVLCAAFLLAAPADAQPDNDKPTTIRDDEIERYLHQIADPVFAAAGLVPAHVQITMIKNPEVNSFVAGGQHIFVHTGLITFSDDPTTVIGVLAHETGHIRGGHLILKRQEMEASMTDALVGYVLGLGSILAGAPGAGAAVISGGQQMAQREFLRYSRGHEESADQAALTLLGQVHISPRGLLNLLEKLGTEQTMLHGQANPFLQSHPLFPERFAHIRSYLETNPDKDYPASETLKEEHLRLEAKLRGFIDTPEKVLARYPETDKSVAARYARAIAHYRIPELNKALSEIDRLIRDYPDDPYFRELKGQMLFENGHIPESVEAYEQAVERAPDAPMMRLGLASSLLAEENKSASKRAVIHLRRLVVKEPHNSFAWHQLGMAYGSMGNLGMSYLALAEESSFSGSRKDTRKYLDLAKKNLPENSAAALKAKEMIESLEKDKKQDKDQDSD